MPNWEQTTTLNAQNGDAALNAKLKKRYDGFECLTEERHDDSECRIEDMALNVELKKTNNTKY